MSEIEVLKLAFRKHVLLDDSIGWDELSSRLCDGICNIIGDDEFVKWLDEQNNQSVLPALRELIGTLNEDPRNKC